MLQPSPLIGRFSYASHSMSAECETVPPQPLTTKPLPASPAMTNPAPPSERHAPSGISYEGRVSVIPPLAGYEATMRAAMELDRAHVRDQQMPIDTARVHSERHYDSMQMQEYRRLYEHQARMHEASQVFSHREERLQNVKQQVYNLKEELQETEAVGSQKHQFSTNLCQSQDATEEGNQSSNELSSTPGQSREVRVKDEPQQIDESSHEQKDSDSNKPCEYGSESFVHCEQNEQQTEQARSPIDKAGESPDLPTDSARIESHTEQQQDSFQYDSSLKRNDNMEQLSPYGDSFQGSDDRMPSSVEPDADDSMDMSMIPTDGEMDPLSRLQHALELSSVMSGKDSAGGDKPEVFQCHICSYSGTSRFHFNAHLNTHYDHKCAKCEFTAHTEPKLREHMQEEHGLSPDSTEDLEAIRVPRVNAQGKVKTFKCKQCDYVAITKGDFWEHARSHIKSEKLLTCPKCPFVTEYKHHLEYHLRNHFGSKPFKCNKCNYSCVNKSMLNSHMKSHSNIYQYRCSDCTYATKYCHSLKLHLRKYGHNPAMVLNPDGSPNPIPIIDVYGTRRGPKLKKDENGMPILPPHYQIQAHLLKAQIQATGPIPAPPTSPLDGSNTPKSRQSVQNPPTSLSGPPISPFPYPYQSGIGNFQNSSPILSRALEKSPEEAPRTLEGKEQLRELLIERERLAQTHSLSPIGALKCSRCEFSTDHRDVLSQHMMLHAASDRRIGEVEDIPRSPSRVERSASPEHRINTSPRSSMFQHQQLSQPAEALPQYSPLAAAHNLKEYLARAMNPFIYQQMMSGQIHPAFGLQQHLQRFAPPAFHSPHITKPEEENSQTSTPLAHHHPHSPNNDGVLDLSKEQTPPQQIVEVSKDPPPPPQRAESHASLSPHHSSPQSSSPPRSETSTPPSKSRRKGRAFKLERIAMRLSESAEGESSGHDEDARREEEDSQHKSSDSHMPPLVPLAENENLGIQEEWQSAHQCQFCDMAFKDVVMYTMHMGYHGYRNPFTCNMCGHQANDKVSFFLHIARSSHS